MLMTEKEFSGLISQINQAFESQFARLSDLEAKVERLINEQQERPTASASRSKRVQQTKKNA
jgi:uncharacterized protein YdcH (DUF465 family)